MEGQIENQSTSWTFAGAGQGGDGERNRRSFPFLRVKLRRGKLSGDKWRVSGRVSEGHMCLAFAQATCVISECVLVHSHQAPARVSGW